MAERLHEVHGRRRPLASEDEAQVPLLAAPLRGVLRDVEGGEGEDGRPLLVVGEVVEGHLVGAFHHFLTM